MLLLSGEDVGLTVGVAVAFDGIGVGVGVGVGVAVGCTVGLTVGRGVGLDVGEGVLVGVVPVCQFQVILEGSTIAKDTTEVAPDAGTLPVPVHPEQVYPEAGDETYAVMLVPLSYHRLVGVGESYCEVTVK